MIAIFKGKDENNLSTDARKRQLERAGITVELILMEFVKFEESVTIDQMEQQESERFNAIKDVIVSTGTEIASQMAGRKQISIEKHTITYSHPSVEDSDNEDW